VKLDRVGVQPKAIRTGVRYANATGLVGVVVLVSAVLFSAARYWEASATSRFASGSARSSVLPVVRYAPRRTHLASMGNCPAHEGGSRPPPWRSTTYSGVARAVEVAHHSLPLLPSRGGVAAGKIEDTEGGSAL
jgi:hypothetical protein